MLASLTAANDHSKPKLQGEEPNAVRRVEVGRDELPLHCPMPDATLWNSHPRVYIPLDQIDAYVCPYCGTEYVLKDPC